MRHPQQLPWCSVLLLWCPLYGSNTSLLFLIEVALTRGKFLCPFKSKFQGLQLVFQNILCTLFVFTCGPASRRNPICPTHSLASPLYSTPAVTQYLSSGTNDIASFKVTEKVMTILESCSSVEVLVLETFPKLKTAVSAWKWEYRKN